MVHMSSYERISSEEEMMKVSDLIVFKKFKTLRMRNFRTWLTITTLNESIREFF